MKVIEVMIDAASQECLMCHLYRRPDEVQTHWCWAYGVKLKTTGTGAVLRCGKCLRNEVGGDET